MTEIIIRLFSVLGLLASLTIIMWVVVIECPKEFIRVLNKTARDHHQDTLSRAADWDITQG